MKPPIWYLLAAVCGLPLASPAAATPSQSARAITVGMAVVDDHGNPVGNIEAVQGDDLLIRTDRHQARMPRSSFRFSRGRLVLNMTRTQLNAAVERMTPTAPVPSVQIGPGVAVRGTGGAIAGTIESVGQDHVILRLTSGERARLPRASVGTNSEGAFISLTTAELQRLVSAASTNAGD